MQVLRLLAVFVLIYTVNGELINLSCKQVKQFVDGHNSRRLLLAQGKVAGQPPAKEMKNIVWDYELAKKASNWAAKEKYGHNPDRTVPSNRFKTGENIYWSGSTSSSTTLDIEKVLSAWWNEYQDFSHHALTWSDFGGNRDVGHYTQMAWSDSIYLGCGVSYYYKNNFYNYFVVCNYGPAGNMIGQTPYKSGSPSNRLICGTRNCSRPYGSC